MFKLSCFKLFLCTLAVATIFATTSCKTMPVFGGPDIPPGDGGMWLDTGSGWVNASYVRGSIFDINVYGIPEDEVSEQPWIDLVGNQVRIAVRFSSKTTLAEQKSAARIAAAQSSLVPLIQQETMLSAMNSRLPTKYEYKCGRAIGISPDKSDLREDKEYIYCVYSDIPATPSNLYVLEFGNGCLFYLRRSGS